MSFEDEHWPRASAWLSRTDVGAPRLGVAGVPYNRSVTPGNYDQTPEAIRRALNSYSTYDFETECDLADLVVWDLGNVFVQADLAQTVETLLPAFAPPTTCLLGGDNGVTRAGVWALSQSMQVPLDRIGLVTLDAHLDLRDMSLGPMNGNPIRGLIEDGLPGPNIHQIGLQSFANSAPYAEAGKRFGIRQTPVHGIIGHEFGRAVSDALEELAPRTDAIYVDIDMDVLDVAYAPGCPGARPGGIQPYQLRRAARICGRHPKVRCADIVELDAPRDLNSQTALMAAVVFLEFAAGVHARD